MAQILVVDDDPMVLDVLTNIFKPYRSDLACITAKNGKEALKALNQFEIDLIITDLRMPIMDGFELLEHLKKDYPNMPVFLMTSFRGEEVDDRLKEIGSPYYIDKPANGPELVGRVLDELQLGAHGQINGVSLHSFLRLIEMDKKTCTITVRKGKLVGKLYFVEGLLVEADCRNKSGESAALEMMIWNRPRIEIRSVCGKIHGSIHIPLDHIIMEAYRLMDEGNR